MHGALVLLPVGGLIVAAALLIMIRRSARPVGPDAGWATAMPPQPVAATIWTPEPQAPPTWRPSD
jgi:hypothetical protein